MRFLYLWPFALLILVPIIILMYLLKQKAVDTPFSSLFLWKEMYKNREADTPWEKLKKNLLMIIQIITVIVLIFALASPYISIGGKANGSVVIIIDNSGGMNTMFDNNRTRLEAAKDNAVEYVENLPANTGITIIASAREATLLVADTLDRSSAVRKIKDIEPLNYAGNAQPGINMAEAMAAQLVNLEMVAFTDTPAAFSLEGGYIVDMRSEQENAAVEYCSYGYNGDNLMVLAKIVNYGSEELISDINLYGDDKLLAVSNVTLGPGENTVVYFENVDFYGKVLCAELNRTDALMADNRGYNIMQDAKDRKVLLMTEQNLYLEKTITLMEGIELVKSNDIEAFESFEKDKYDLYIFDGMLPEVLPKEGNMIIINCEAPELYTVAEKIENVLVKTENTEVTKYLADYQFGVSSLNAMEYPLWAESFLSVGAYTAGFIGNYNAQMVCVIGFDFHHTELPLKMEFPLLMHGIMNKCVVTDIISEKTIASGETIRINKTAEEEKTRLLLPSGKNEEYKLNIFDYKATNELGVYVVDEGEEKETVFAVNFPEDESKDMVIGDGAELGSGSVINASDNGIFNFRNVIIMLALLALGIEWIIYIRG